MFIAVHGSWNRSKPIGYYFTRLYMQDSRSVGEKIFAEGWIGKDASVAGRLVDLCVLPSGFL
jgi:glucose/arabinose dehydrogenase